MVTSAPWGAKAYGDTKRAERAGDRRGTGGSWTCKASSKGTVWPFRAQTQETLTRHQLGVPRVTPWHFSPQSRALSWHFLDRKLLGGLHSCAVSGLPAATNSMASLRTLLIALPLRLPGRGGVKKEVLHRAGLRQDPHSRGVPSPPPDPSHLLVWLQKPFSSSSTGLPVWLTVGELEHGAGRAAEVLSLTHCFCAGQVLAAPREMRRLPPMCSCAPLCWSTFYDHQKLCTGQSHKGSGEQLIGKLPLHHPQIPAPGPSQGQGDCQGQGRQAGITRTASPLNFPNQGIPVPPSPGHSPKS